MALVILGWRSYQFFVLTGRAQFVTRVAQLSFQFIPQAVHALARHQEQKHGTFVSGESLPVGDRLVMGQRCPKLRLDQRDWIVIFV